MKKIPILVPLFNSYHILDRFINCINLEKKTEFILVLRDNTEFENLQEQEKKLLELYDKYPNVKLIMSAERWNISEFSNRGNFCLKVRPVAYTV